MKGRTMFFFRLSRRRELRKLNEVGAALVTRALPDEDMLKISAKAKAHYLTAYEDDGPGTILKLGTNILELIAFGTPGRLVREYFGTDFIIPEMGLCTRRFDGQTKKSARLPYHQDAYVFPMGWRSVNCWTLLYPEDVSQTSRLELIPVNLSDVIEKDATPQSPAYHWLEADRKKVDSLAETYGTWQPQVRLGDVLMFNHMVLHRTVFQNVTKPRLSLECRLVSKTPAVMAEYDRNGLPYFFIKSGELVRAGG